MSVTVTYAPLIYSGDGIEDTYTYNWPIQDELHLYVLIDGVTTSAYTIDDPSNPAGSFIVFDTPPDDGAEVIIYRDTPELQQTVYNAFSSFPSAIVESDHDKRTMNIQEIEDDLSRTVKRALGTDYHDAGGYEIKELGNGTESTSALTSAQIIALIQGGITPSSDQTIITPSTDFLNTLTAISDAGNDILFIRSAGTYNYDDADPVDLGTIIIDAANGGIVMSRVSMEPGAQRDNVVFTSAHSDTSARVYVMPKGKPTGDVGAAIKVFATDFKADGSNYQDFGFFLDRDVGVNGRVGTMLVNSKVNGHWWGLFPAVGLSTQDGGEVPLRIHNIDTTAASVYTAEGAWEEDLTVATGEYYLANFHLYQVGATGGVTTAGNDPSHVVGTVAGTDSIDWVFIHDFQPASNHKGVVVLGDKDDDYFLYNGAVAQFTQDSIHGTEIKAKFATTTNDGSAGEIYADNGNRLVFNQPDVSKFHRFEVADTLVADIGAGFMRLNDAALLHEFKNKDDLTAVIDCTDADVVYLVDSAPNNVTSFTGKANGQMVRVVATNGNSTLVDGANLVLKDGANVTMVQDEARVFMMTSTSKAVEVGGPAPAGAGSGDVTKVGTPVNNEVGVWTGDGTLEGDANLTWDGATFNVTGNITTSGTVDGIDIATDVAANTAKDTNATHTGDVTGSGALTIADEAVTLAKMQHIATDSFLGRDTAATGDVEVLSAATARSVLNVADGANAYSHPNHSGDVTSTGDGATVIAADAVTYAKMQNVAADNVLLGNNSGAGAIVDELTAAEVRTLLGVNRTAYGEMYIDNNSTATTLAGAATWTQVTAGWTTGEVSNITFSTNQLDIDSGYSGRYRIGGFISYSVASTGNNYEWGISSTGTPTISAKSTFWDRPLSVFLKTVPIPGLILNLTGGTNEVSLWVRNTPGTNDPTIWEANLNIVRLGA